MCTTLGEVSNVTKLALRGQSKIYQFCFREIIFASKDDVFQLDISMDDILVVMQVLKRSEQPKHYL